MKKDSVEKQKINSNCKGDEHKMSTLHTLKNAEKAWQYAKENTKYNENGQATISKEERESEPDWE